MSKARGCFIAFILVFILGLIVVLLVLIPSLKSPSAGGDSTEVMATDNQGSKTAGNEQPG